MEEEPKIKDSNEGGNDPVSDRIRVVRKNIIVAHHILEKEVYKRRKQLVREWCMKAYMNVDDWEKRWKKADEVYHMTSMDYEAADSKLDRLDKLVFFFRTIDMETGRCPREFFRYFTEEYYEYNDKSLRKIVEWRNNHRYIYKIAFLPDCPYSGMDPEEEYFSAKKWGYEDSLGDD